MCFDAATGKFLWQQIHDKLPAGQVHDWPHEGICSSPCVEGDRMWYVSNRCEVVCRDTDGKDVWTLDMIGKLGVFPHNLAVCSPMIVGDTLFVITSNGVDEGHINIPKPGRSQLPRPRQENGQRRAIEERSQRQPEGRRQPQAVGGSRPGADARAVVQPGLRGGRRQGSDHLPRRRRLAEGGRSGPTATSSGSSTATPRLRPIPWAPRVELANDFLGTPVVHDNKLYIGVGQDPEHEFGVGHYWCLDLVKGRRSPAATSPTEVGRPRRTMGKLNRQAEPGTPRRSGTSAVWITPTPAKGRKYSFGRTISTAAVADGLCYVAELEGILHCLDANTGKEHWHARPRQARDLEFRRTSWTARSTWAAITKFSASSSTARKRS